MNFILIKFLFFAHFVTLQLVNCYLNKHQTLKKFKYSNHLSRIKIKDNHFIDENNRVVLFRGINAVRKEFPWIPNKIDNDLTNKTHLNNLKQWGFNVVRLGVMWAGLIPEKDRINQTYLNEIIQIVDDLASFDIYTIIDLHQDMLSSKFNSYDGAPLWLLNEMPDSKFKFPWPLKNETINMSVFAAYVTESCGFAFQCLYDNVNRFNDYFQQYWEIMANTFVNNSAILGYEILNEPWAGDVYANPLLLMPGFAGRLNLLKLYDRTYETIRKFDQETLVFYEPVTWGVLFNRNIFGTGFSRPPGDDSSRTVLSWHYYCWFINFTPNPLDKNGTYPTFDKVFCDQIQLVVSFEAVKFDMLTLGGGPSFLTEFGVCAFQKPNSNELNTYECEAILNANDKYLQSWAYWDSTFYDIQTRKPVNQLIDIFSRVYPLATNGIPIYLYYNTTTKDFMFSYKLNLTTVYQASLPTEILVPKHIYPDGFYVVLSDNFKWSYDKSNNLVLIYLSDQFLKVLYLGQYNQDDIVECKVKIYSK